MAWSRCNEAGPTVGKVSSGMVLSEMMKLVFKEAHTAAMRTD